MKLVHPTQSNDYLFILLTYFLNLPATGKTIEEYRRQLGSFGVSGDLALQTIGSLSGGQKSRVAFARMCMGNPNFLVLDEPTNHLDIETIEALGKGINKYTVSGFELINVFEKKITFGYEGGKPYSYLPLLDS